MAEMALTWLRNALGSNPQDPPFLVLYPGKSHGVQCAWLGKISFEHSSGITLCGVPNAALHLSSIASRRILSSPLRVPHERREYFCKPDCRALWRAPAFKGPPMALNRTCQLIEVFDAQDGLAADRDTTIQLPYRLRRHSASGRNVRCSPLFELMMRELEHPNTLLRE